MIVFQYAYGKGEFGACAIDVQAESRAEADAKARARVVAVYGDAFRPEELEYCGTSNEPAGEPKLDFVCRVPRRGRWAR